MGRKVCLRCKGKTLLGVDNKLFVFKSLLTMPSIVLPFTPQANFPAHNLNLHWRWRWWDCIQAIFLNLFYVTSWLYFFVCFLNLISSYRFRLDIWIYSNIFIFNLLFLCLGFCLKPCYYLFMDTLGLLLKPFSIYR